MKINITSPNNEVSIDSLMIGDWFKFSEHSKWVAVFIGYDDKCGCCYRAIRFWHNGDTESNCYSDAESVGWAANTRVIKLRLEEITLRRSK